MRHPINLLFGHSGNSVLSELSLKSQTMAPPGMMQSCSYHNQNQLESAVEQPVGGGAVSWSQTFGYDDFGNRWVAGFTGSLPGGGPRPNGASWYQIPVAGQGFVINNRVKDEAYDAAGNQLSLGGLTGAYDAENRLKSAGPSVSFSYDAFGRRVGMVANGKTTVFVYNAMGGLTAEYVVGQTAGTVKRYVVQDQLGSTRLVTDAVGGVLRRSDYLPYGEEIPGAVGGRTLAGYGADGGVRQGFTGKERDGETGLDYFGARFYSGALGRFTSLDLPLFDQIAGDPLSWNLFSYVRNNPLQYTDPTGRGCVSTQSVHTITGLPLWTNTSDLRVPGASCEQIEKADKNADPAVTVTDQPGSFAEYLLAARVPRYVPNDKPLDSNARRVLAEVGKTTAPIAILADCAAESYLPITTAAAGESVWQLGLDTVRKPFAAGGNPYTSQLAIGARAIFGSKGGGFPSVVRGGNGALRISNTNFGGFVGRALGPLGRATGVAGLAIGIYQTGACVARN